jgi:hypothetical protein
MSRFVLSDESQFAFARECLEVHCSADVFETESGALTDKIPEADSLLRQFERRKPATRGDFGADARPWRLADIAASQDALPYRANAYTLGAYPVAVVVP